VIAIAFPVTSVFTVHVFCRKKQQEQMELLLDAMPVWTREFVWMQTTLVTQVMDTMPRLVLMQIRITVTPPFETAQWRLTPES
jgi:sensor domain CHASE-containing protein